MKSSTKKPLPTSLTTFIRSLFLGLYSAALIACGGGGGGGSDEGSEQPPTSSSEATESYQPNSERLLEEATNSEELYVEENFKFDHTTFTQLNVSLVNSDAVELSYTRLNIYLLDTSEESSVPTEWSDDLLDKAHLISGGLSNEAGEFTRIIEFPKTHQRKVMLLIEVNAIGFENKALVTVTGEQTNITLGAI